jgi:hypothetical protein
MLPQGLMTSEVAIFRSKNRNFRSKKVVQTMAPSVLITGFALKDMKTLPRFFYPNGPRVALLLGSP